MGTNRRSVTVQPAPTERAVASNQTIQRLLAAGDGIPAGLVDQLGAGAGNQAIQRVLAIQRAEVAVPTDVDAAEETDETVAPTVAAQRTTDLGDQIRSEQGVGHSLPLNTRQALEGGLGSSLNGVRVHHDATADRLSRSVDAVAFTSGQDIFFRSGAYDPGSPGGRQLLAHEAAHTIQQSRGPVSGTPAPGGVSLSDPNDSFERAADHAATKAVQRVERESGEDVA
jgi:hypothetical protein